MIGGFTGLGYGQTWKDLTASRVLGVTYYNTTGKPIIINAAVNQGTNTGACVGRVNGSIVTKYEFNSSYAGSISIPLCFIVPNGSSYSISANESLNVWSELRV